LTVRTLAVTETENAKTGRVALSTYRTHWSCCPTCPLWWAGCYAENRGKAGPFGHAERGTILDDDYSPLVDIITKLPEDSMVRLNVSGDYLLDDGSPDMAYIEATNRLAGRHDVLSYTHAWKILDPRWFEDGARPNASCDKLRDVAVAKDMGWQTVIVDPGVGIGELPGYVECLYDTKGLQCIDCGLCAAGRRRSTVVFPVHGARKNAARAALMEVA
jgi:hypothetical protein